MAKSELRGITIASLGDIDNMPRNAVNERVFARLLLERTELEIAYEPTRFDYTDEEGRTITTIPDFRVRNLTTGVETFIEITAALNGKDRQRLTMEYASPDTRYRVFCADKLRDIQNKFPEYEFNNLEDQIPVELSA